VAHALSDLAGPRRGLVRLRYETVLREARGHDDLAAFLDDESLVEVWDRLWLPPRVRQAWEAAFPSLALSAA
jgi:hypothetical protein